MFKENQEVGNKVIFWDFVERENYLNYCLNFSQIVKLGYVIKGVTSDRHGSLISAIKTLFPPNSLPQIPHQYCLVHLQRFCQTLLTQKPQTQTGIQLLELARSLNSINSHYEANIWLKWFQRLEKRHQGLIRERSYLKDDETGKRTWWYTHKNLRRAFKTLDNSKEHLFLYLDYLDLPKDINGLEAEFSHLKGKLNLHKGLKRERKINLIRWYFYLKSKEENFSE